MTDILLLLAGMTLLYVGGERLIDDASEMARRLGMSSVVVGLTVVAFATSSPELAASLAAALTGTPDVAFGNVVGSNIANLGLILGATALVAPLLAAGRFLTRELPLLLGASLGAVAVVLDGRIGRIDATLLLLGLGFYVWWLLRDRPRESRAVEAEFEAEYGESTKPLWKSALGVTIAVVLLVLGARLLVLGAVGIARDAGVSDRVIGLTVVALWTSLPELVGSIAATLKKEPDIALGNLVGSNVFNLLLILGTTALVHPLTVEPVGALVDLAVMLGFTVVIWPFLWSRLRIGRIEGAVLLLGYAVYIAALFA
ncbi:MAG: calcium/sodium antiporter [Gemmatimonadota bacterium]|nr:calcium/sodium antiporter [Gemmatimonadota bacterium]